MTTRPVLAALLAVVLLAAAAPGPAPAQSARAPRDPSVGLWRAAEDGRGGGLIRTYEQGGRLFGRIEAVSAGDEAKACTACAGADKGRPLKGFVVLRDLQRDGEGWSGGTIVDPENGKIYGATARPAPDGRALVVRGYVGAPMFGQSRTWPRAD